MNDDERYRTLVFDLCASIEHHCPQQVFDEGKLEHEGFEVLMMHVESDAAAMYMTFNFGALPPGRTLRVFRLMLEANLSIYAQDQAQLGLDSDNGCSYLIVRIVMSDDVTGPWLVETMNHYLGHGRYWKETILNSDDEMFAGVCLGNYAWIRA